RGGPQACWGWWGRCVCPPGTHFVHQGAPTFTVGLQQTLQVGCCVCLRPCPRRASRPRGRPICASDGKLYKSACAFQKAQCRDPLLEVVPRFRCDTNLTRCQEDRAAALSQSRHQTHGAYVPECDEDGSFLQVQCHKQTGYCWCSTPEGKPISGTSVLNDTPNCTGSVPLSGPRSGGTYHCWWLTCPDGHIEAREQKKPWYFDIFHSDVHSAEYPPSCEQERREAIDEARQHQQEGTFIPECEGDGTYKAVQCHQATGYCWCVRVDTGRPVPGTSTRSVQKAEFLSSLIKALASDMLHSRMMFPDSLVGPSLEERAVRWHFIRLDKDFSNSISERELRPLKLYMKKNTRPKRCVRKFLDYCDLDENKHISLHELKGCLGLMSHQLLQGNKKDRSRRQEQNFHLL
uniref:Thyroglobulin type-1 domain-containing protein n=1 Tax=Salvator merianae TaxID=96440 RepID=A0A8D0C9V6_SALMN